MISSNSFSSSSTRSSLSSGADGKDVQICYDEPNSFQTQNSNEGDYPMLTISEISDKDERYWERRRKNNAAAKRSRERRRQHDVAMEKQIHNLKLANALLKNEIFNLQQRLVMQTSTMENPDIASTLLYQHHNVIPIDDMPHIFSDNIPGAGVAQSPNVTVISSGLPVFPSKSINGFPPRQSLDQVNPIQNPLDLSFKMKEDSIALKLNSRSHSKASTLDQRYWDRRRRNNEAVRKCRQNKKVKMQSISNNQNPSIVVDEVQIQTKIDSMTSELEKLKSQLPLKNGPTEPNVKYPIKIEESVPKLSQRLNFNDDCKRAIKWKNKLIQANQAEKEISNQTRV